VIVELDYKLHREIGLVHPCFAATQRTQAQCTQRVFCAPVLVIILTSRVCWNRPWRRCAISTLPRRWLWRLTPPAPIGLVVDESEALLDSAGHPGLPSGSPRREPPPRKRYCWRLFDCRGKGLCRIQFKNGRSGYFSRLGLHSWYRINRLTSGRVSADRRFEIPGFPRRCTRGQ
jgi:hypothetical protein